MAAFLAGLERQCRLRHLPAGHAGPVGSRAPTARGGAARLRRGPQDPASRPRPGGVQSLYGGAPDPDPDRLRLIRSLRSEFGRPASDAGLSFLVASTRGAPSHCALAILPAALTFGAGEPHHVG